ncbi:MAG: CDP-archaeol synthase, partial [Haloarculaceae archaeon]
MAILASLRTLGRRHPGALTAVLSVVGYVLVGGALYGFVPLFPPLSDATVDLFSHLIAVVNALALTALEPTVSGQVGFALPGFPFLAGLGLAFGAMLGDIGASFVKRRSGRKRGASFP